MSALEVLIAARARIATPDRWCQGAYWRGANGEVVESYGSDCVSCCSLGALHSVGDSDEARQYLREANAKVPCWNLAVWNDAPDRTHAEVLAAFDRAIELAGGVSQVIKEAERHTGGAK